MSCAHCLKRFETGCVGDNGKVPGYEAILFDFDGVLVDSEPVHYECWCEVLSKYGVTLEWNTYEQNFIGVSDRALLENVCKIAGPPLTLEQLLAEYPNKKAMFRDRIAIADVFAPGTLDLIRSLRDYKLAVVSSSNRLEVEPSLVRFGVRDHFQALVCGNEAAKLKPAPDPYLKAAELLGVRHALVVEDSAAGEASGRAAGFDVLRVAHAGEVAERVRERLGA